MIYIFHGDDQYQSQQAYQSKINEYKGFEKTQFDNKTIDFDKLNQFINSQSLFGNDKVLILSNPFSLVKANLDKLINIVLGSQIDIVVWQDRNLKPTENNLLGKSETKKFPMDKKLFACLNSLKPGNTENFCRLYQETINQEPFELFLFWLKNNIRKSLTTYSKFPEDRLKDTYLKIIEMEHQYKTGQLTDDKENSLIRLLIDLMS